MFNEPLLFSFPEIKAVAERLSKEKGEEIGSTLVL